MEAAGFEPEYVETHNITKPDIRYENPLFLLALGLLTRPLAQRRELLVARGIKRSQVIDRYPVSEELYYRWDVDRLRKRQSG
jgi:hypothetical protein